jgi:parallel beta-helix repeat protein
MIHRHVFPKSYSTNILPAKAIATYKPNLFLSLVIVSVFRFLVLSFTTSVGVAYMAMLGISPDTAIAQMPRTTDAGQLGVKTMSQVNVVFVNPSMGDDKTGNGSEGTPLKTITQALKLANPNTVIMLSSGNYTAETGESFPLILKPNVSIQGDPRSKGRGIVIQGGGDYLSRTFGGKNVTIVGANQARLTGVTVTNPNPRGYGLWIEYSSPVIVENTFTGSTQDGVAVTGNSAPTIASNFFYQNGANGITISGNSRPQLRENVFQQTGFGINITQNAQPIVVGNSIQYNRSGIVVQANARPTLRNNLIQGSKEDGLVAIAQAIPNLGIDSEPGQNQFRNNARYDINASASKQIFPAFGNTLANNRINGKVDFTGTTAIADAGGGGLGGENLGTPQRPDSLAKLPTSSNNASRGLNRQLQPLLPVNSPLSVQNPRLPTPNNTTSYNRRPLTRTLPRSIQAPGDTSTTSQQANYVRVSSDVVEFTAPQVANNTFINTETQGRSNAANLQQLQQMAPRPPLPGSGRQIAPAPLQRAQSQGQSSLPSLEAAPVGDAALLPVPNSNIPVGNTGNLQKVPVSQTPTTAYVDSSSQSSAGVGQINLRYRVVVETQNDKEQELVKFLSPGAFRTVWRGKGVMQVGVFSTRYNADSVLRILNNNGLKAVVEPIN